jgi:23S rRNA (cytidine2498-2'-O)-methyltransferase
LRAFLSTVGFEPALVEELARARHRARAVGAGVVVGEGPDDLLDPVFARQVLPDARAVEGESVRALAEEAYALVEKTIDAWSGPFSVHALTVAEPPPGLGSRAALVGRELLALLAARRRRASRRYLPPEPAPAVDDPSRLLVQLLALDRSHLLVSAAAPRRLPAGGLDLAPWPGGAAPVATDRAPPSRAYQKLEEALAWMGTAPGPGDTCVDLGASPGGWTATLLKRGARVIAVDRAPLAPPLDRHERVATVIGNAFNYTPAAPVDWLVSDVICEPARSLELIARWLERDLCRRLVVTVKFKGQAGYGILADLPPIFERAGERAGARPVFARTKQLAHNKNEVTVMVTVRKTLG